jgi:hypothetical protein
MLAIATFEYRRSKMTRFDRKLAKVTLRKTVDVLRSLITIFEKKGGNS